MRSISVLILAGGRATRLYPITYEIPKSLINIAGKPFIDHQLALLIEKGVDTIFISIGHLGDLIREHISDGSGFHLNIRYIEDGDQLLGTGGAVQNALHHLPDPFMIMYGDSYLDTDYSRIIQAFIDSRKNALMTIYKNRNRLDRSNILYRDGIIVAYDKTHSTSDMEYIDYGLLVCNKHLFMHYSFTPPYDLADLLLQAVKDGNIAAYEVKRRFYEIGSERGIRETDNYIQRRMKRIAYGIH